MYDLRKSGMVAELFDRPVRVVLDKIWVALGGPKLDSRDKIDFHAKNPRFHENATPGRIAPPNMKVKIPIRICNLFLL